MAEPGASDCTCVATSAAERVGLPWTASTRSPTRKPARAAGESGTTADTSAPLPAAGPVTFSLHCCAVAISVSQGANHSTLASLHDVLKHAQT